MHRSDGSGTTFIFTNYLSKVNADWKTKVGEGTAVKWPTGVGGKGNEGVAGLRPATAGSIGYVEYAYAKQNKMAYTLLKNKDGNYVPPDGDELQGRGRRRRVDQAPGFYLLLTDPPGEKAWPITGATFILMHKEPEKPAKAAKSLKFFDWAYKNGDKTAADWTTCRCRQREGPGPQVLDDEPQGHGGQARSPEVGPSVAAARRAARRPLLYHGAEERCCGRDFARDALRFAGDDAAEPTAIRGAAVGDLTRCSPSWSHCCSLG